MAFWLSWDCQTTGFPTVLSGYKNPAIWRLSGFPSHFFGFHFFPPPFLGDRDKKGGAWGWIDSGDAPHPRAPAPARSQGRWGARRPRPLASSARDFWSVHVYSVFFRSYRTTWLTNERTNSVWSSKQMQIHSIEHCNCQHWRAQIYISWKRCQECSSSFMFSLGSFFSDNGSSSK